MKLLWIAGLALLTTGCSVVGIRTIEQARYTVVERERAFEVRDYEDAIVAETTVPAGSWREEGDVAFNRLAGYIFGENDRKEKIKMTAPVMQEPEGEKIAMTAPVLQERGDGISTWAFVMPSKYTLETLPKPRDSRVELRLREGRRFAALRYRGRITDARREAKAAQLRDWVEQQGYTIAGFPTTAGYDPPWTVPFLRRNEVLVEIEADNERDREDTAGR